MRQNCRNRKILPITDECRDAKMKDLLSQTSHDLKARSDIVCHTQVFTRSKKSHRRYSLARYSLARSLTDRQGTRAKKPSGRPIILVQIFARSLTSPP